MPGPQTQASDAIGVPGALGHRMLMILAVQAIRSGSPLETDWVTAAATAMGMARGGLKAGSTVSATPMATEKQTEKAMGWAWGSCLAGMDSDCRCSFAGRRDACTRRACSQAAR